MYVNFVKIEENIFSIMFYHAHDDKGTIFPIFFNTNVFCTLVDEVFSHVIFCFSILIVCLLILQKMGTIQCDYHT